MHPFIIILLLATVQFTRPSPLPAPLNLPMYPEPNERYLYSYNYRAYRGNAFHSSQPVAPIAVVPLKKVESHHIDEKYYPTPKHITYAGADKDKKTGDEYDEKYWANCRDAHIHAWKVGSPTLYQCAAIACAKGQSPTYRHETLKYCGDLEKEARKGGKDLKGW